MCGTSKTRVTMAGKLYPDHVGYHRSSSGICSFSQEQCKPFLLCTGYFFEMASSLLKCSVPRQDIHQDRKAAGPTHSVPGGYEEFKFRKQMAFFNVAMLPSSPLTATVFIHVRAWPPRSFFNIKASSLQGESSHE